MRYRFVRYCFSFDDRQWLDTDSPSKHFVYLQTSLRHFQDMSSRSLQEMSSRRLQEVFSVAMFRLPTNVFWDKTYMLKK